MQQVRERNYKTEWMRKWRANNPEKQRASAKRSRIRQMARQEAIEQGIAAPILYQRYGVLAKPVY